MKRSQPRRNWDSASWKRLNGCRVCGQQPAELAHTIGRKHDTPAGDWLFVRPESVVPLCKPHHDAYDGRSQPRLDLLPHLDLDEQIDAVRAAGGIESARRRLCPSLYSRGSERRSAA